MDHAYIDEHNIIARYGMGKLSSAERLRFEEHLVDCPGCQKQLETTRDFRQALKTVAAEDAAHSHSGAAPFGFWGQVSRWRPALIAVAACLVIFAIPTFLLLRQTRLAHAELNQAKAASETWQRQSMEEQQARAELEKQLREGQQNRTVSGAAAASPMVASIFVLETVRGDEPSGAEPVNQVVLSRPSPWVVLSVDRDDLEDLGNYQATLSDSHGQVLWQLSNLAPVSSNALGISLPANLLHEGDYLLTLEGRSRQGRGIGSRQYPFRVRFKR